MNNVKRVTGEDSKKDECFKCHGYGHKAFECATRLNRLRQESQPSQTMKATQNSSNSSEENSEEEMLIAFTTKVEQDEMCSISRGSYFF